MKREHRYTRKQMEEIAEAAAQKAISSMLNLGNCISPGVSESDNDMPRNEHKIRRRFDYAGSTIWICADSEREYADKLLDMFGGKHANEHVEKHLFKDYAKNWFEKFSKPNISPITAITYERQLNNNIYPTLGDKYLEDITVDDVQTLFNNFKAGTKKETKTKTKTVLLQIFKKAYEDKIIQRNPMDSSSLKITGGQSEPTTPYTVEQMRHLAASLSKLDDTTERTWLAISISLPLRPEEVLGLKWEDIDLDRLTVSIKNTVTHPTRNRPYFSEYTKTATSRRVLILPKEIKQYLPPKGNPNEFVVGGKEALSYTFLRNMRKRIAKKIGFDDAITPRRFRTTVATDISAQTHDIKLVQQMLGHSTPEITLKYYDKGRNTATDATSAIANCYKLADVTNL
jgi:integrase